MKLLLVLVFASLAFGQGVVTVSTTLTATAGTGTGALVYVATPGVAAGISTMHVVCTVGTQTVHTSDSTVPSTPATAVTIQANSGTNVVTWQLTKGNPTPDGWSVAANGVMKAGIF